MKFGKVFFLIMLLGLTPGGLPCFILFILFENMIRQITILAKETKSLNEKGREGGSSKLNDVAKKLPAHTVQLKMTAAVVLSTRDQTSKSSYSIVYTRPISPKLRLHCIVYTLDSTQWHAVCPPQGKKLNNCI